MARDLRRQRSMLHSTANWWETDRNRLRLIRTLAYLLFVASVGGTVYSAVKNVLPTWAITLYVAFAIQFIFMTFMYAIKHSGLEEIRRSIFALRRERVGQWRYEREMLAEFARYAFCVSHKVDPMPAVVQSSARQSRLRPRKAQPWPAINSSAVVCGYVKEALASKLDHIQAAKLAKERPSDDDLMLSLDFVAYSSETLINLSREVVAEIDELLQERDTRFEGVIVIRILTRDTTGEGQWLIPLARSEEKDREYATDLRTRFKNVRRSALKEFQEGLKDVLSPKQVDFRVRGYRTEPLVKGVLVDRTKGIFGLYTIDDLKDPDGWDYSGHAVTMCPCDIKGDFVESTAARFLLRWFEEHWDDTQLSRSVD